MFVYYHYDMRDLAVRICNVVATPDYSRPQCNFNLYNLSISPWIFREAIRAIEVHAYNRRYLVYSRIYIPSIRNMSYSVSKSKNSLQEKA
jgi:hypothetical protein